VKFVLFLAIELGLKLLLLNFYNVIDASQTETRILILLKSIKKIEKIWLTVLL